MAEVAVVIGETAGVRRATVRELSDARWDVGVIARARAGLDGAVADVDKRGRRRLVAVADVADHDAVECAAAQVEDGLGVGATVPSLARSRR